MKNQAICVKFNGLASSDIADDRKEFISCGTRSEDPERFSVGGRVSKRVGGKTIRLHGN